MKVSLYASFRHPAFTMGQFETPRPLIRGCARQSLESYLRACRGGWRGSREGGENRDPEMQLGCPDLSAAESGARCRPVHLGPRVLFEHGAPFGTQEDS
jgi:hypothetical protein